MKRAEVETSVALPGTGAVDHAMPVMELVISASKAGHECSRSIDASRAALRRPKVREQIEHFWSHAPPVPSGFSVDEHADFLAKAARWHGSVQHCGGKARCRQTGWMTRRGKQFVLTLLRAGYIRRLAGFSPSLAQDILFAVETRLTSSCGGETLGVEPTTFPVSEAKPSRARSWGALERSCASAVGSVEGLWQT